MSLRDLSTATNIFMAFTTSVIMKPQDSPTIHRRYKISFSTVSKSAFSMWAKDRSDCKKLHTHTHTRARTYTAYIHLGDITYVILKATSQCWRQRGSQVKCILRSCGEATFVRTSSQVASVRKEVIFSSICRSNDTIKRTPCIYPMSQFYMGFTRRR